MKKLMYIFLFLISTSVFSADLKEMIKTLAVDKKTMSKNLEILISAGQLTPNQAAEARAKLNAMSDKDFKKLKRKALQEVKKVKYRPKAE